jgi:hypothetical protein
MLSMCGSRPSASRTICQFGKSRISEQSIVRTARHTVQHAWHLDVSQRHERCTHPPTCAGLLGQFACVDLYCGVTLVRELSTAARRS